MANTHSITVVRATPKYVYAPDSASLSITGNITIEFWVNIVTAPTSGQLFGLLTKDDAGTNRSYWVDYYNNAGTKQIRAGLSSSGANAAEGYINYDLGTATWVHIAVTITPANGNSTKLEFFVNGTSQGNGTGVTGSITSIFDSGTNVVIGGYSYAGLYSDAKFDDVRIWNTIRTQTQINTNKSLELVGNETNLQAYWKLNNSLSDSTSNGNTLTNVSSAAFTTDVPFTGSTNYTQSATESITLSDGYIKANTKGILENLTIGEVIAASKLNLKNIAEAITLSEVVASLKGQYKAIVEAITIAEVLVHAITKSIVESITTSDTVAGIKVIVGAVTDSITVSDAYSYTRGYALTILETLTIADAKTVAFTKNIIDSVTISEVIGKTRLYFKSILDSTTIGEAITTTSVRAVHIYESISVRVAPAAAKNGLAISLRFFKKYAAKVKTFAKKYIIYP